MGTGLYWREVEGPELQPPTDTPGSYVGSYEFLDAGGDSFGRRDVWVRRGRRRGAVVTVAICDRQGGAGFYVTDAQFILSRRWAADNCLGAMKEFMVMKGVSA